MTCGTPKRRSDAENGVSKDNSELAREKNERSGEHHSVEHLHCCCGLCACECDGEHCPSAHWALTEEANDRKRIRLLRRLTEAVRLQFETRGDAGPPRRQFDTLALQSGRTGGDALIFDKCLKNEIFRFS